jgi:hypothetical protein
LPGGTGRIRAGGSERYVSFTGADQPVTIRLDKINGGTT